MLLCRTQTSFHFLCRSQIYQIQNRLYHLVADTDDVLAVLFDAMLHLQIILMGFLNEAADRFRSLKLLCVNPGVEGFPASYIGPKLKLQFLS